MLFVLFATSKSHYSEPCAELFMSHVGRVTSEHITGTARPELWSPGTALALGCQSPPAPWKPQAGLRGICFSSSYQRGVYLLSKEKEQPQIQLCLIKNSLVLHVNVLCEAAAEYG